jgi:AcrR family transcriptional regulator
MAADTSRPSLREAQRAVTEQRIVEALAALIDEEHPLEISMAAIADRAAVSEPTLYRHFPTKRDLFAALAGYQFRTVAAGLAPSSVDDLAEAVRTVFERSADMENSIRWTLAAPDPQRVPRPNAQAHVAMLRTALGDRADKDDDAAQFLLRTVLLLTSPMAWLYWKDYLGLEPEAAAATAGWAIKTLASPALKRDSSPLGRTRQRPTVRRPRVSPTSPRRMSASTDPESAPQNPHRGDVDDRNQQSAGRSERSLFVSRGDRPDYA